MFTKFFKLKSPYLLCILSTIGVVAIYLFSLCPTVYLIDSGELAAVSYTLGIAHPTGYPLYTLISYFFSHLPGEPILLLNMLSSLLTVTGLLCLFFLAYHTLHDVYIPVLVISITAFAPTVWRTSITNEVYPLTILFSFLILLLTLRIRTNRDIYLLMYIIGLSLTNHIIIVALIIPVIVYILIVFRPPLKKIFTGAVFAALGVSLYLYLITRTLGGAELAWGNTYNVQRFFWHVTGKQYQVWMFSLSFDEIMSNVWLGLKILSRNFLYIFMIPVVFGFYHLLKTKRKVFWLLLAVLLLNIIYAINYSIPDIESYYIPACAVLAIALVYGFTVIKKYIIWYIAVPLSFIIPAVNITSCTLRNNSFGLDFGQAHIEQLPENSLLVCSFWDIYSPIMYLREVKHVRTDLVVIDKELLRRTWYIKHLKDEYPGFYHTVAASVDEYLVELYKFEYDRPYQSSIIQTKFITMLERFVASKLNDGVFFALPFNDHDLQAVMPSYLRLPRGLVFQVTPDTTDPLPFDFSALAIGRPATVVDERLRYNIEYVKRMIRTNINYLHSIENSEAAVKAKSWLAEFLAAP